jgi:hypothetical protein
MEPFLTYSLRFRHFKKEKGEKARPPELVFTVRTDVLQKTEELLRTTRILEVAEVQKYLGERPSYSWDEPHLPLDSANQPFGIGGCGYVKTEDSSAEISFPITASQMYRITKTINVLMIALNWSMETGDTASNKYQLFELETRCERAHSWGHITQGHVFPVFRRWIASLSDEHKKQVSARAGAAIKLTWYSLLSPGQRKKARAMRDYDYVWYASINSDGRFQLVTLGNACDLSIYPDSGWDKDPEQMCKFSCHNLDEASQQLSLLAGLAVLMQLAEEDIEKM